MKIWAHSHQHIHDLMGGMQAFCSGVDEFLWLCRHTHGLYEALKDWQPGQAAVDLSHLQPAAPHKAHHAYRFDSATQQVVARVGQGKQKGSDTSDSAPVNPSGFTLSFYASDDKIKTHTMQSGVFQSMSRVSAA